MRKLANEEISKWENEEMEKPAGGGLCCCGGGELGIDDFLGFL